MVTVNNISRNFPEVAAVRSVSFTVAKGEIFGIVGPDGSGKSTLMRLVASILRPHSGSIVINGMDASTHSFEIKKGIAYMPQRFGLYEDLTVEENIHFFGRLHGMRKNEIHGMIPRLYNFSSLGPFSTRLAGKLSGGMKQKLGLACCLVHKPSLILLDEPTNGVDPVSRREFWKILYDLLAEGVAVIVSTSYLDEAERCGRVALMHRGEFIRVGVPKDIKKEMPGKLLSFLVDRPMEGEMILRLMKGIKGMHTVIRTGNLLKVFADDHVSAMERIKASLEQGGLRVESSEVIVPSLEDCFVELVSEEE